LRIALSSMSIILPFTSAKRAQISRRPWRPIHSKYGMNDPNCLIRGIFIPLFVTVKLKRGPAAQRWTGGALPPRHL
jgi:hypothetical protein